MVERLILEHPKTLLQSLSTARWPFESTWIETDINPLRQLREHPFPGFGVLIDQDMIYNVCPVDVGFLPGWERYQINSSWSPEDQDEFFHHFDIKDRNFWVFGSLIEKPSWKDVTDEDCQLLWQHASVEMRLPHADLTKAVYNLTLGSTILVALAAMVLLNTPKLITEIHVPASRHFSSGKLRRFNEHTDISINVTTDEVVRYVSEEQAQRNSEAEIARRRLHEVRGHFAHNQVARTAACVHTWIKDDERHFHCATCGGRRWWRPHHERGDEALGRIPPRQYRIT